MAVAKRLRLRPPRPKPLPKGPQLLRLQIRLRLHLCPLRLLRLRLPLRSWRRLSRPHGGAPHFQHETRIIAFSISIFHMAEITAALVGKLREVTNAGLMDCKRALAETGGDMDKAVDVLRKKGVATAAKKASREAKEGLIAQHIQPGARLGALVEVNCETDFVAKNDTFRAFCDEVARKPPADPNLDLQADRGAAAPKSGEN